MVKIALIVIIAMFATTFFNDPNPFKSWREVAGHISLVVAKVVKGSGEAACKFIRNEVHEDSVIDKTKDAVSDAGNSVKQAVTVTGK